MDSNEWRTSCFSNAYPQKLTVMTLSPKDLTNLDDKETQAVRLLSQI